MSSHLGIKKTYSRIIQYFYWPKLKQRCYRILQVVSYMSSGRKAKPDYTSSTTTPYSSIEEPFSRVIIDCVGPLPKMKAGHQYILTIMCASTRFPETIPLRNIKATNIVKSLTKFFTLFGLPNSVQTDQGISHPDYLSK